MSNLYEVRAARLDTKGFEANHYKEIQPFFVQAASSAEADMTALDVICQTTRNANQYRLQTFLVEGAVVPDLPVR